MMSDDKRDTRSACRFGIKCYQKNAAHHEKFKHPPKRPLKEIDSPLPKKIKNDDETFEKIKQVTADKKEELSDDDSSVPENVPHEASSNKNEISDSNGDLPPKVELNKISVVKRNEAISDSDDDLFPEADEFEEAVNKLGVPMETSAEDLTKDSKKPKAFTSSNFNVNEFIRNKFLVTMPKDFHQFWEFCKKIKHSNPLEALSNVGLHLVGPYDVLAGKFSNIEEKTDEEYLLHWRYYYDPPEFQTVLKGDDSTGFHIGYFRDDPAETLTFMVANYAKTDGTLEVMGDNIFAAVSIYLDKLKRTGDPFKKMHVGKYQHLIKEETDKLKLDLSRMTPEMSNREKKVVTKTFNKLGIVVPFNKKSQLGYRELAMGDKELKSLLTKLKTALPEQKDKFLSDLQPVLTYANIAMDECDFGTGLELGINIFAFGVDSLNQTASRFLMNSYKLLKRDKFAKIAEAHMKNRRTGSTLSIL